MGKSKLNFRTLYLHSRCSNRYARFAYSVFSKFSMVHRSLSQQQYVCVTLTKTAQHVWNWLCEKNVISFGKMLKIPHEPRKDYEPEGNLL